SPYLFFILLPRPPRSPLFPYTTLFRSLEFSSDGGNTFQDILAAGGSFVVGGYNRTISPDRGSPIAGRPAWSGNSEGFITTMVNLDRKSTRLNSSHVSISYAVFCLKKKR